MKKTIIVTDSNSGITQLEAKDLGVVVVPMPFTIDGEEFMEDISITQEQFYEKLSKDLDVMTSQPSHHDLEELFLGLLNDYESIVFIPMSSGLSGTCENAKNFEKQFDGRVFVVDNKRISVTQRESVMEALSMSNKDISALEIKNHLEKTGEENSIYIAVDTLKYLKKGGRISKAAATLGDMFKLKPVLQSTGGAFEKLGIAFNMEQAKKKMIQKLKQDLDTKFAEEVKEGKIVMSVAYTNCLDKAIKFKDELVKAFPSIPLHFVNPLSLSVSCHIGSGALAVALSVNYNL